MHEGDRIIARESEQVFFFNMEVEGNDATSHVEDPAVHETPTDVEEALGQIDDSIPADEEIDENDFPPPPPPPEDVAADLDAPDAPQEDVPADLDAPDAPPEDAPTDLDTTDAPPEDVPTDLDATGVPQEDVPANLDATDASPELESETVPDVVNDEVEPDLVENNLVESDPVIETDPNIEPELEIAPSESDIQEPDMDSQPDEEEAHQSAVDSTEIPEPGPEQLPDPPADDYEIPDSPPQPVNGNVIVTTPGDTTPPPTYDEDMPDKAPPIYPNTVIEGGGEADEITEIDMEPAAGSGENGDLDPIIMMYTNDKKDGKNSAKSRTICFTMFFIVLAITAIGVVFYLVLYYENQDSPDVTSTLPPVTAGNMPP